MSNRALNWALRECTAKGSLRGVITVLADHAQPKEDLGTGDAHVCWPGLKAIAAESGWSTRTVEKSIPKLADYGIQVQSRKVPTVGGACNLYILPVRDSDEVSESETEVSEPETEVSEPVTEVSESETEVSEPVTDKPKPKPKEEPKLEPNESEENLSPEEVDTWLKENRGGDCFKEVGIGSGSGVTLNDLFRKIETLQIRPEKRVRAHQIARKLWGDTDEGKSFKANGEPVKDLLGLLMHRLQKEHVIKPKRK